MWLDAQPPEAAKELVRDTCVAFMASNLDGKFLWCNQAFEELVGYTLPELENQNWKDLTLGTGDREAEITLTKEVASGHREDYAIELQYLRKNNEPIAVRIHVTRYPHTGEFQFFWVSAIPLVGDKENRERLKALEKQIIKMLDMQAVNARAIAAVAERKDAFSQAIEWTKANPTIAGIVWFVLFYLIFGPRVAEIAREIKQIFLAPIGQQ